MSEVLPFEVFEKFLSPFSGHMLEYKGTVYTTLEHAYHCQRFSDPALIQEIKDARSAKKAWELAQPHKKEQAADWDQKKVEVMEVLFRAKLAQHEDVQEALIGSGEMLIVKHQATDAFWGDGADGNGQNQMGKLWMKLRAELR